MLWDDALTFVVGIVFIIIGVLKRVGEIPSVNRDNAPKEALLRYDKGVGTGIIVCGCAVIVGEILHLLRSVDGVFYIISAVVAVGGVLAGLGVCAYAYTKYNKTVFKQ